MKMSMMASSLRKLKKNERIIAYKSALNVEVTATRTDKICPHDFAVGLLIPGKAEFNPTHIRVLTDLYLKRLSDNKKAQNVFLAIERIYNGCDPSVLAQPLRMNSFTMQLDDVEVNLFLLQLLMIEQDFNFGEGGCKKSKLNPPREFLMRFVRWVASGETEIDKIVTNAVRNWPPPTKYAAPIEAQTD